MTSLSIAKSFISRIQRESRFVFPTLSGSKLNLDLVGVDCAFLVLGECVVLGGVLAWERGCDAGEGGEGGGVSFSDGEFGVEYRPFLFCNEDVDGSCVGCGCWAAVEIGRTKYRRAAVEIGRTKYRRTKTYVRSEVLVGPH